jgi:pimeloyl-ACP methyl ester carboxylesterase
MTAVVEGVLDPGLPYLRLGAGPPLVMASGLSAEHANPTGLWRRMTIGAAAPFAQHFTVYLVNRKVGLVSGATMSDIAADYAEAIQALDAGPVRVHGTSTGGSVALQLAIDHPHLVRRLVVSAAACRLGPRGREVQAEVARLTRAGESRQAWAQVTELLVPPPLGPAGRALGWLVGGAFTAADPSDMLVTIDAEDAFDVEPDLPRLEAPTLVLGGTADPFYSEDLFRRTAAGVADGRLVLFPGKGHMYVAGAAKPASVALGFLLG